MPPARASRGQGDFKRFQTYVKDINRSALVITKSDEEVRPVHLEAFPTSTSWGSLMGGRFPAWLHGGSYAAMDGSWDRWHRAHLDSTHVTRRARMEYDLV